MEDLGKVIHLKHRFYREGPPYLDEFEKVMSQLFGKQSSKHQAIVDVTLSLLKEMQFHLGDCHALLGRTEQLIEEARSRKESPEEIEKLAEICRDIQATEVRVAEAMKTYTNQLLDLAFPR